MKKIGSLRLRMSSGRLHLIYSWACRQSFASRTLQKLLHLFIFNLVITPNCQCWIFQSPRVVEFAKNPIDLVEKLLSMVTCTILFVLFQNCEFVKGNSNSKKISTETPVTLTIVSQGPVSNDKMSEQRKRKYYAAFLIDRPLNAGPLQQGKQEALVPLMNCLRHRLLLTADSKRPEPQSQNVESCGDGGVSIESLLAKYQHSSAAAVKKTSLYDTLLQLIDTFDAT
ncbi:hypothetical protein DAPPUDRAFT_121104, partial [Daphnia pulex]